MRIILLCTSMLLIAGCVATGVQSPNSTMPATPPATAAATARMPPEDMRAVTLAVQEQAVKTGVSLTSCVVEDANRPRIRILMTGPTEKLNAFIYAMETSDVAGLRSLLADQVTMNAIEEGKDNLSAELVAHLDPIITGGRKARLLAALRDASSAFPTLPETLWATSFAASAAGDGRIEGRSTNAKSANDMADKLKTNNHFSNVQMIVHKATGDDAKKAAYAFTLSFAYDATSSESH